MSNLDLSRRGLLKSGTVLGAGFAIPAILASAARAAYTNEPAGLTVTLTFNVPQSGAYTGEGADELR